MDVATWNLVLVVAGSIAPSAIWLLVPLIDAIQRAYSESKDLIVWTLFGSFAAFADRVVADDYRGADAE